MWRKTYSELLNSSKSNSKKHSVQSAFVGKHSYDNIHKFFCNIEIISSLLIRLPLKKSVGADKIAAEHIRFADQSVCIYLSLFYNACLKHGYIPPRCLDTIIVPVAKNTNGKLNDPNNYRPVALATVISKLFEHVILNFCSNVFATNDNQFGFKSESSADMCVFTFKQMVASYNKQSSAVYSAFLDASKAFDRVNHYLLFQKLIDRGVPLCFVRILCHWYSSQNMHVKWDNCISQSFCVTNGVRQGGVLSPYLFAIYIDDLSIMLNRVNAGCYVGNSKVNHLMYADDICCFSSSLDGLQELLNVCDKYAETHEIVFNSKKSLGMLFQSAFFKLSREPHVYLGKNIVNFGSSVKYLGVFLNNSLSDDADIKRQIRYLYGRANYLKSTFAKCSHNVKNILFRAYCTTFYAGHLWCNFTLAMMKHLNVAYNDSYRLLHGMPRNTSAREMQVNHNIVTFDALIRKSLYKFLCRCKLSENKYIRYTVYCDYFKNSKYFHHANCLLT